MPNPLTDELTPEAKQELAAVFADMRRRYDTRRDVCVIRRREFWQRRGW